MMSTNSYLDILHVVGLKTRTHGQFGGVAVQCGLLGIAGVDVGDRVLRGGRVARGGDEGNGAQAEGDDRSSSKDLLSDACAAVSAYSCHNGAHARTHAQRQRLNSILFAAPGSADALGGLFVGHGPTDAPLVPAAASTFAEAPPTVTASPRARAPARRTGIRERRTPRGRSWNVVSPRPRSTRSALKALAGSGRIPAKPPPAGPGSGLMSTADAEAPGHRAACTRVCGLERAADALGPPPACARDAGSQPVAQELLAFSRPI